MRRCGGEGSLDLQLHHLRLRKRPAGRDSNRRELRPTSVRRPTLQRPTKLIFQGKELPVFAVQARVRSHFVTGSGPIQAERNPPEWFASLRSQTPISSSWKPYPICAKYSLLATRLSSADGASRSS